MSIEALDHVAINTEDLEATLAFYEEIVGLERGPRPDVPVDGAWLYAGGHPVVHVIVRPIEGAGGGVDHFALRAGDFEGTRARLEARGVDYTVLDVAAIPARQIMIHDPGGVKVELNFPD